MAPVASENNGVRGWGELGRCDPISSGFARPSLCVFLTPGQSVGCIALGCFTASLGLRAPGRLRDSSRGGLHWCREPGEVGRGGPGSGVGPDTDAAEPGRLCSICVLQGWPEPC